MKSIYYLVLILFSGGCSNGQNQGSIIVHAYFWGADSSEIKGPSVINNKIWFKGNQSIQEVPVILFGGESSGKNPFFKIKHYSYLDPDANAGRNYYAFSDTAKVFKQYSNIDSVIIGGGWNFYSNQNFQYDSSTNLSDTVINKISYGRIRLDKKINDNSIFFVLYHRCDKKETLIRLFKPLSDSIGCPIVRDDTYIKNKLFMTREIEFVSDKLTRDELEVFEAWKKNGKKL